MRCQHPENQKFADMLEEAEQAYWERVAEIAELARQERMIPVLRKHRTKLVVGSGTFCVSTPSMRDMTYELWYYASSRLDRIIETRYPDLIELMDLPTMNKHGIGTIMEDFDPDTESPGV